MPELPEVETVVRSLSPLLAGRRIEHAEFHSPFVTPGDRLSLARSLEGRTMTGVRRHGKFIVIDLDRGVLVVHLGMTGKLLVGAPRGPHAYGFFVLNDGTLVYDDPRQFGRIEYGVTLPERLASLGPDPLEVSREDFTAELRRHTARVKSLLLNQRFLRGIGNIYADEALFRAGIHPKALSKKISRTRAAHLHEAIVEVLQMAIEHRGSSISDYVDAAGERGNFQLMHNVYGREGEPCRICGTPVKRIVLVQRGTHFCPACQRL